jgi:hypothetical protein
MRPSKAVTEGTAIETAAVAATIGTRVSSVSGRLDAPARVIALVIAGAPPPAAAAAGGAAAAAAEAVSGARAPAAAVAAVLLVALAI